MKILILQLSDLHIKNSTYSDDVIVNPIISALQEIPSFDRAIIVISGDIAFSGKKEEYGHANHFIGKIISRIKSTYFEQDQKIDTIIVPGNHDIDFNGKNRDRSVISNARNKGFTDKIIEEDLDEMKNFFDFAKYNRSFSNNKKVDKIIFDYDGYKLQFNLINSAPLSVINDSNGDNDQALHYISPSDVDKLNCADGSNVCFTVLHHGFDWFDYESSQLLEKKLITSSSIIFVGHNHIQHSEYRNVDGVTDCIFMKGGIISTGSKPCEFNCIILDTDSNAFTTYDCKSDTGVVYKVNKQQEISLDRKLSKNGFHLKKEYYTQINSAEFNGMKINDMFVFPNMIHISDDFNEAQRIDTYEDFLLAIKDSSTCIIEGDDLSGKTQLLKYIYTRLFDKKLPIFIDAEDINKKDTFEKIIKKAFSEQYSEISNEYSAYSQLKKEEKAVIIDNINRIKNIKTLIEELNKKYSLIICTTCLSSNIDVKEALISEITESNEVCRLRLEKFYYEKRNLLIRKACDCLFLNFPEKKKSDKAKEINDFIVEQLKLFDISPYFILSYCSNYARRTKGDGNNLNIFGEVFKANMVKAFQANSETRVDTAFFVLGEIAFKIMLGKEYPLSISSFNCIVLEYNEEYGNKINPVTYMNDLIAAKIIKYYGEEHVKFYSTNILAYFAGKRISDYKDTDEGKDLIRYLIKNICFGINSEVIRFIIASSNDATLLNLLIDEINLYFNELEEFSFSKNNLSYLSTSIPKMSLQAPNKSDKKMETSRRDSQERMMISKNIEVLNIFDYNENDLNKFVNKEIRLQRLSILTASLYANFYHIILAEDKNKFVQAIYSQPNKIIYYLLEPFNKDFSRIVDEIYQEIHQKNENVTKEMIAELFIRISETIMLNVFDFTARSCGTQETIDSLREYTDNHFDINNRMLLTMIYENMGMLTTFGRMAEKIDDDNTTIKIISNMIKRIVHKHYVWNNVPMVGYAQHLADRYFDNNKKKIETIRNKSIRIKK